MSVMSELAIDAASMSRLDYKLLVKVRTAIIAMDCERIQNRPYVDARDELLINLVNAWNDFLQNVQVIEVRDDRTRDACNLKL